MSSPFSNTEQQPSNGGPTADAPSLLRAVHTPNFPELLRRFSGSLVVTTYQAGKLVLVRDEGDHLNTHFRAFRAPMGLAVSGERLAIGTALQIWEFHNVPAVCAKLDPPGRHDFVGYLAFVGLSQVRETAVCSGIRITERLATAERTCGVAAVDLTTGRPAAVRGRRTGGLRRPGVARQVLPRPDQ